MVSKPSPSVRARKKTVTSPPRVLEVLESGQIWKAGEIYVQIKEAGKKLIHYKMAKTLQQRGLRRHLASIKTVRAFLKAQRAELMPGTEL